MTAEKRIFSVSEVNNLIKLMIDNAPELSGIYIRGELSNYKIYPSGHHYFTLKDSEGALRCVMFRSSAERLRFRPENGMKVILHGRISVFPRDGQYQMYCTSITPDGIGDLAVAFEQLKNKMQAQGMFDEVHKKPLPTYPEKIAIITSSAGAAVHDMIRILRHRYPICKVLLLPVRVQGTEAPAEIAGAIRYANRWKVADLIITGRGGGSIEDLWAFNDERVAMAIYESELPVISAVGHEPDVTIADFVADVRASTPSNAAELAVPDRADLSRWLRGTENYLSGNAENNLVQRRKALDKLAKSRVLTNPMAFVQDQRMLLDYTHRQMMTAAKETLSQKREIYLALTASLDAMSPMKVLGRGYAVAKDKNGKILKDTQQVQKGDTVCVTLENGDLQCAVTEIQTRERKKKNG